MAPGIGRTAARRLRSIGCVVGALFVLLGLIAIPTCGLLFVGSWCLIFMGGFLLLLSFLWDALANFLWLRRTAVGLLGVGSALFLALLIWMIYAGWFLPPDEGPYTVIVLGAKVEGDSPSLMLQRRLEVSRDVLLAHPDWPVIVTGGQGSDESRTEASVMAEWLIAQGIESSRIHLEDRSTNTAQNIEYAKAILEAEELPPRMLIVSDGFHLARARMFASWLGIETATRPSVTPWWLAPAYWVREMFALCYMLIFGSNA